MAAPKTLTGGDTVWYLGLRWTVSSVFNTNTEGWRANLTRNKEKGTERCSVPFSDLEVER